MRLTIDYHQDIVQDKLSQKEDETHLRVASST